MTYVLQMSYVSKCIEPRHLVVKPSKSPFTEANLEADVDMSHTLTNFIPKEWETEFALLYDQERIIIDKRRELLVKFSKAFPSYIRQYHPEILV